MINLDEHKKLLEQITELEKNSVNYFDVEKEFFLIDSDNLPQVRPRMNDFMNRQDLRSIDFDLDNLSRVRSRLYGYSIQRSGIYENDNLTPEAIAGLDGRGCYVYVEVKDGKITIKQDLNGSWGIYLFRHGDYFALSNSFFRLLDHVKFKYPLTINRDYCHYWLVDNYSGHAYCETAVNEIRLLERNAIVHIDVVSKNLDIEFIDYKELTIYLDSAEGIAKLDKWVDFWSDVLRGVAQNTDFLLADLSGGFDSRVALITALNSGIDSDKLSISSIISKNHTYPEDYAIASKIATHYGLTVNKTFSRSPHLLNLSLDDMFNLDFYSRQIFSRTTAPLSINQKNIDKIYKLNGFGGETIRDYWRGSPDNFIKYQANKGLHLSSILSSKILNSIKKLLESDLHAVSDKHHVKYQDVVEYMYYETECRCHFGKFMLSKYLKGEVSLSPIIDPDLRTLRLNTKECSDAKLLIAFLFTRYAPDLLKFPFDSKHFIAPETIEYAKKINERFPRRMTTNRLTGGRGFHLQPRDLQAEKILAESKKNPNVPWSLPKVCLKAMFDSSRTYGLFTTYFDAELYRYAASCYESKNFGNTDHVYATVGTMRVLQDVEISQHNHSRHQDLKSFLEQDFVAIRNDVHMLEKFKPFTTARINIKLMTTEGDFQIVSVSDDKATKSRPSWFQKDGVGYNIDSYAGELNFTAKATVDGQIKLWLRGIWVPDQNDKTKLIPYWIDYTKLTVNGETIFDTLTPAWCNKPYTCTIEAKADEEIKIHIEWQPHRSDT